MSEFKSLKVKNTAGDVVCPSDKVGTFALNENLKTINDQSIVGTGNISISGANSIKVNSEIFNVDSSGNIDIGNVLRDEGLQYIIGDSDGNGGLHIEYDSDYSELNNNRLLFYSMGDSDCTALIGFESIGGDSDPWGFYFEESGSRVYFSDITEKLRRLTSSTTKTGVSSISTDYQVVYATVTATSTLSFSKVPFNGYETHVIIKNNGSSVVSITLPNSGSYVCTSESTIYIAAGKYGEVNVVGVNGAGYVHGISSI